MRFWSMIRGEAGYTSLVEATAAVAIGLSLVAILTPVIIGSTDDADLTRASTDVEAIRLAITSFNSDVAEFPVRGLRRDKVSIPARSGDAPMLCLRTGNDPKNDPTFDNICNVDVNPGPATYFVLTDTDTLEGNPGSFLNNHLLFDASVNLSLGYLLGDVEAGTPPRKWKGPYINETKTDPWGANYIILGKGFSQAIGIVGTDPSGENITGQLYAWVLSAGRDGVLSTTHTSSSVQGDDVGALAAVISQLR